jgi:hypothetical protein
MAGGSRVVLWNKTKEDLPWFVLDLFAHEEVNGMMSAADDGTLEFGVVDHKTMLGAQIDTTLVLPEVKPLAPWTNPRINLTHYPSVGFAP